MEQKPLVTIGVVTFNAEEFITETLDSIYEQSYQNIELIVTDDNSSDKTVEIAQKWLEMKGKRFNGSQIITTPVNTGVSANSNRALMAAKGEWYKCFDGDDLMAPNAISDYMSYVIEHPDVEMMMANVRYMRDGVAAEIMPVQLKKLFFGVKSTVKRQSRIISKRIIGNSQSFIVKTSILKNEGGFDEKYPLLEDYPVFIKLINRGHKMYFMENVTAFYRSTEGSISRQRSAGSIFTNSAIRSIVEYRYDYQREYLSPFWQKLLDFSICLKKNVIEAGNNWSILKCRMYYSLLMFDPLYLYKKYTNFLNRFA